MRDTARSGRTPASTTTGHGRSGRPHGPKGGFLVGNLAAYDADRLGFLLRAREEYGGLVAFDRLTTIVNSPTLVAQVLRQPAGLVEVRENFLQERLTPAEVARTLQLRGLLNPGLRAQAVHRAAASAARLTRELLLEPYLDGCRFDPTPVLEQVISHAVADFHFGPGSDHLPDLVGALLDELGQVIGNPFALPASWHTPTRRRIQRRHRDLHRAVLSLVAARAERRDDPCDEDDPRDQADESDLVATILDANRRQARPYSLERIAGLVIGSLLAAQRVPAAAASWALMMVADHPRLQRGLSAQIRSGTAPTQGGRAPAIQIRHVVLESLRLYPATWLITRTATGPVAVGGYRFAAGHNFLISPYVVHRDPASWADPDDFDPRRWLLARPPSGSYLPFGAGIHTCPGRHLATTIIEAALTTVLEHAALDRSAGEVVPDPRTTLIPRGLTVQLRSPRAQAPSASFAVRSA